MARMRARRISARVCVMRAGSRGSAINAASLSTMPRRRSAAARSMTPPSDVKRPRIEGGDHFLALDRWKSERQEGIFGHGGCGSHDHTGCFVSTPQLIKKIRTFYNKHPPKPLI